MTLKQISRPTIKVKQGWAWSLLRWVTARESQVLQVTWHASQASDRYKLATYIWLERKLYSMLSCILQMKILEFIEIETSIAF